MDYMTINEDQKRNALINRMAELEQQHYTNQILLDEAELVGAQLDADKFKAIMESLELRINDYRKKIEEDGTAE